MRFSRTELSDKAVGGATVPRARKQADGLHLVRCLPAALVPRLRALVPPLPEHTAVRIRAEIPSFAGPDPDRLHRLIREAVAVAVDCFLRLAGGDESARQRVDAHFRDLGRAEVAAGISGHRVLAAIQVAADTVWQAIHGLVAREELSGHVVADLGMAVSRYLAHLAHEVQHGMAEQRRVMADERTQLVRALMREPSSSQWRDVVELATATGWPMPDSVVVVMAQLYGHVPGPISGLPEDALTWMDGDRLVVVTIEEQMGEVTAALLALHPGVQVAQSWSVPLVRVRHAYRWARRGLALARKGEVRMEGRVVPCMTYRMRLWLAADEALADEITQDLLAPLQAAKPRRRLALAETLLAWLETDESASALARRRGVHPNTVRSHLGVLRGLFGDGLHQPDQRTVLILALEAALPRWRAELAGR